MNEKTLTTFLMVIDMGSFSGCAEVLGTKQSTVSARINQLEKELGVKLFQRGKSGATLTRAGKRFETHCKQILSMWRQAARDLNTDNAHLNEVVHLSVQCNMSRTLVRDWVDDVLSVQPGWSAQIDLNCSEHVFRQLHGGETDIGLVFTPIFHPELDITKLYDEKFLLFSNVTDSFEFVRSEEYVKLNFSPYFEAAHKEQLLELSSPRYIVGSFETGLSILNTNGGSIYLPELMANQLSKLSEKGALVRNSPVITQPVYSVVATRRKKDRKVLCVLDSLNKQVESRLKHK